MELLNPSTTDVRPRLLDPECAAGLTLLARRHGLRPEQALGAVGAALAYRLTRRPSVPVHVGRKRWRVLPFSDDTTLAAALAAAPAHWDLPVGETAVVVEAAADDSGPSPGLVLRIGERGQAWRLRVPGAMVDAALLADRLRLLIDCLVTAPDRPLSAIDPVGPSERALLASFAGARRPLPEATVPELIRRQALATPERIALRWADGELTYADHLDRAAEIAGNLRAAGVGRGDVVGLCAERSADSVAAVLGIMLAGAAYLPLEVGHPASRLRDMLETAKARTVLASDAGAAALRDADLASLIRLTGGGCDGPAVDWRRAGPVIDPLDPAYVLFTSGSTGRPKGVQVPHQALVNRLTWMQDAYRLVTDDVVLHKTPATFDVSLWELLWPFMTGARLVVAPPEAHRDATEIVDLVRRERVTTVHFVPAMLDLFLAEPDVGECHSLVRVICSGEALAPSLVNRLAAVSDAEVHNLYGPTEAAIDVTAWRCRRPEPGPDVPIGAPIANVVVHVLDDAGRLAPVGAVGEMFLGGVCLATGYIGSPELTAQSFVQRDVDGVRQRLYRTGDLVWWDAGGNLHFVGRRDNQVKLRGQRVELGEIEAVLGAHPAIGGAAVTLHRRGTAGLLVGYFVRASTGSDEDLSDASLREYLSDRLPEHMVPSRYVEVSAMPLTTSGKVDRAALPEPSARRRVR
ncbi:amino acid adenylation domain-containing protein [Micromonospora sp. B006]|uniref:amino acid adenylation domain-containing protein n=1 Tax=Micromonospora sp. B006 TaxID=2201999 RepID=UPI000E30138F|nr:amino acid adenylation domain-containing protein [Micromonospora sp. B006]AXO35394.1 enterobactin synthetase component F [Micromonospora sp. B006]